MGEGDAGKEAKSGNEKDKPGEPGAFMQRRKHTQVLHDTRRVLMSLVQLGVNTWAVSDACDCGRMAAHGHCGALVIAGLFRPTCTSIAKAERRRGDHERLSAPVPLSASGASTRG